MIASKEIDEFGLTESEWAKIRHEEAEHDRHQRLTAIKTVWTLRKPNPEKYKYIPFGRGDDWSVVNALKVTFALIFYRNFTDDHEKRCRAKLKRQKKLSWVTTADMAFWDHHQEYFGTGWQSLSLCPGLRYQIFHDTSY